MIYNIFLDLANLLTCLLAILIVFRIKIIPSWIAIVLIVHCFVPFFLNDFLFPAKYMSDQFRYYDAVKEIRIGNFEYTDNSKVMYASYMLSLIPLPFVETIKSLGFFNKFIFIILFIWLYNKKFLKGITLYMLLFYPTLILYTSLSLRDTLIFIFMIISLILFIDKKYIKSFLWCIPLYFIKIQNLFLLVIFLLIHSIFNTSNKLQRLTYLFFLTGISVIILIETSLIETINYYRYAMFIEDNLNIENYISINNLYDLLKIGFKNIFYFLLKPLPWEFESLFQGIQSLENFIIFILLIYFTIISCKINLYLTLKWVIFLLTCLFIYGIVVSNFGTASRYRFPILLLYFIGLSYDIFKTQKYFLRREYE